MCIVASHKSNECVKMCLATPTWIFMGQRVNSLHVGWWLCPHLLMAFCLTLSSHLLHPRYVVFDFSLAFNSCCSNWLNQNVLSYSDLPLGWWSGSGSRVRRLFFFFCSRRMWQWQKNMIWFMFLDCCGFHSTFIQSPTVPEQIFGYFILCPYYIQNLHSNF